MLYDSWVGAPDGENGGGFHLSHVHSNVKTPFSNRAFKNFTIYSFLAALGPCCFVWAYSSCGGQGPLFIAMHRLLIAVASLVAEDRL